MKAQSLSDYGAEMTPEHWQQLDELFQSRLEGEPDKRALLGNAFDRKAAALPLPSNLGLGRVGYLTWHDRLLSH